MKIAAAATVRRLEKKAHEALQCHEPSMMEKASKLCADAVSDFRKKYRAASSYEVIILAGKGNNGGDGILTGSYLSAVHNIPVTIYSLQSPKDMSDEILRHFHSLPSNVSVIFINEKSPPPDLKKPCIIVDALLGIGFKGELREPVKSLINSVNSVNNPVISIDIPSGIETDSGNGKEAIYADMTITIGAEKKGLYISDGRIRSGSVKFADIGFDLKEIPENEVSFEVIRQDILDPFFRRPTEELYKTKNGKVLIIGGSQLYPGAVVLAALGANSVGCGLLTAAIKARPFSSLPPNIIVRDFSVQNEKSFSLNDLDGIIALAKEQNCIVFGMGVTVSQDICKIIEKLLQLPQTLILDADALNTIARFPAVWQYKKHSNIIITPHFMEAARLAEAFGIENFEKMSRIDIADTLCRKMQCTVVLKGDKTVIASPDGRIHVNPVGSYALAKGGSGDVLSGIIGAMAAQKNETEVHFAAAAGVFIHASAADDSAQSKSAFDIAQLPDAVKNFIDEITIF